MLIGYNNDVEYRGKKFHIQTEDHGENDPRIESQIFHQGQILDTEIVSYGNILEEQGEEDDTQKKLKSLMWAAHKGLYRKLMDGSYDDAVGLEPVDAPDEVDATDPEEFEPGQDRVPAAAQRIEEQGQDALEEFHANEASKHVDLDSLKGKLSELNDSKGGEDSSSASSSSNGVSAEASSGMGADSSLGSEADLDEPTADELLAEEEESKSEAIEESQPDEAAAAIGGRAAIEGDGPAEPALAATKDGTGSEESPADPRTAGQRDEAADEVVFADDARAWSGCEPPADSLDLVPLVEGFIES